MSIQRAIRAYYTDALGEHHRYRSWEHCYGFFRRARSDSGLAADRDHAALQLAFYLASWGMYRGSSFLLQHTYTVHRDVIDLIAAARFDRLWEVDLGARDTDAELIPLVHELVTGVREAYGPFVPVTASGQPTETLITKVILGTFGCLPACDRYFIAGFKRAGLSYSALNDRFMERLLGFCREHMADLHCEQAAIRTAGGPHYPLMKLVDMYFWQLGYEADKGASAR